jgi:hypothetical protein
MLKNNLIRLRHHEIDKAKWDAGIARSTHPLIYAESWYLDIVAPNWESIVSRDYGVLWPLTLNRKYKWPVIMQPMYAKLLGMFASETLDQKTVDDFGAANKYPILTLQCPSKVEWSSQLHSTIRSNSVLPLQKPYAELRKAFSQNCQRNIKKALQSAQSCHTLAAPAAFIAFTRQHKNYLLPEKHLKLLEQIVGKALDQNSGFILQVTDHHGEPLAMAFFLRKHKRLIFLSGQSSPKGLRQQSMFLIMNQVIQNHAGSDYLLDFDGSEVKGIARFYASFGAVAEPYQCLENPLFHYWQKFRKRLNKKNS